MEEQRRRANDREIDRLHDRFDKFEENARERHDTHMSAVNDMRQMCANVTHIFSPEGPWADMATDVKRHNKYETAGKAIFGLGGLIGFGKLASLLSWFHIGKAAK